MALSATSLHAQVAQPDETAPVAADPAPAPEQAPPLQAAPEPAPEAVAPVVAPPPPATVQAIPPTNVRLPDLPQARPSASAPMAPRSAPAMAARTAAPAPQPAAQPRAAAPVSPAVQPRISAPISAQPDPAPAAPTIAAKAPAPATDQSTVDWILGIGGGLLLVGGASLILLSRRDRREEARDDILLSKAHRADAEPVSMAPAMAAPSRAVRHEAAPAMTRAARSENIEIADRSHALEAMVAAPPSADNPFLTRKKRLRRAKFVLEQGNPAVEAPAAPKTEAVAKAPKAEAVAKVAKPADKPQAVYSFGRKSALGRKGLKPSAA